VFPSARNTFAYRAIGYTVDFAWSWGKGESLSEQTRVRRQKRELILAAGNEAYPAAVARNQTFTEIRAVYRDLPAGGHSGEAIETAGRVVSQRDIGGILFATLDDGGAELQVLLTQAGAGEAGGLAGWRQLVDLGDIVAVRGEVVCTSRGELTVACSHWEMAAKALRPLPAAHRPLSDEVRVRQRYVDLIVRPAARSAVTARAAVLRSLRESFHPRGYTEVETPLLHAVPGGANARPFVTRSNALDCDLYLRIAPELFLKRCIVGGVERVYEINRNFRNEGVDSSHSPEFSALEAYAAFADYHDMAELTASLVRSAVEAVAGGTVARHADGREIDFGGQWPRITLYGAVSAALGEEVTPQTAVAVLAAAAAKVGIPAIGEGTATQADAGRLVEEIFDVIVAPKLERPTFVFDYPVATSPLTRAHRSAPGLAEKWDLYVGGMELATAYSELTDPVVQRGRFEAQARLRSRGDEEAMRLDEDFLRAIEYGMPPTGGMGMGIDRLLMAITGLGIRETILFPLLRPEQE
jgi:lysyl-tRNA synthetase class 2